MILWLSLTLDFKKGRLDKLEQTQILLDLMQFWQLQLKNQMENSLENYPLLI